ncbi:nucleoside diphosphate kinase, mitochondrial isoform X2 [Phyllostomus hastatus]|uniref:nucleoside diphosphate kinase, mitochondrial isoform X2 n=1 Tax=Phyllostomus hastatus TaxID=9423 RepID=UPI001E67F3F7|nr:nucleoside diphosphate kinase, mitochondrial isoform X2 [Phyllostomus hastatus]
MPLEQDWEAKSPWTPPPPHPDVRPSCRRERFGNRKSEGKARSKRAGLAEFGPILSTTTARTRKLSGCAPGSGAMTGLLGRVSLRRLLCGRRTPVPSLLVRPNSGGPSWTWERTLVAVKPDGVQRRLVGDVIRRFERRGFKLVGMKMLQVWEGPNVVCTSRAMIGHTDSAEAAPGTIRGDFSFHITRNVIHASNSVEEAQREIRLWFQSNELVDWADEGYRSSLYPS